MRRGVGKETSFDCQNHTLNLHSFNVLDLFGFVTPRDLDMQRYDSCLKKLDDVFVVFILSELVESGVTFLVLQSLQGQRRVDSFTWIMEENGLSCATAYWMRQRILCTFSRTPNRSLPSFSLWSPLSRFAHLFRTQSPSVPQLLGSFLFRRTSSFLSSR